LSSAGFLIAGFGSADFPGFSARIQNPRDSAWFCEIPHGFAEYGYIQIIYLYIQPILAARQPYFLLLYASPRLTVITSHPLLTKPHPWFFFGRYGDDCGDLVII
jgi:hypothetical protein